MNLMSQLTTISTFIFDMDGVLTDGTLYAMDNGELVRRFNIKDGYAIKTALEAGCSVIIISGGKSEAARKRLESLGISDVYMGVGDKAALFADLLIEKDLSAGQVLYMGDDLPDYQIMKKVGVAACPSNAALEIKEISQYVSAFGGGAGCVRDVIEKVLKIQGKWS